MSTNEPGTPTPPKVIELATQQADLPRIALIGVFGGEGARGALIRESNGKVQRVQVGDRAAGGIVAAIGEDRLIISSRSKTKTLVLPAG